MRKVHTRSAVPAEDDEFLFNLYASTRQKELAAWGWAEEARHQFLRMQFQCQRQSYQRQYPDLENRIIFADDARAGRILTAKTNTEMVLVDIALLPEFHSQGIGTALLADLQQEAKAVGMPLRLSVLIGNSAKRLYERMGFKIVETNEMYAIMRWQP